MKEDIEKIIDSALREKPEFQLRQDFSDLVIKRLRKLEAASQRKLYFWIALGTLVIFGSGAALIAIFVPATWLQSLKMEGFDQIIPLAVAIGVVVGVIQYLDKRLVKDKMLRMH